MSEREQLLETIAELEAKREILGDDVVDQALAPLRTRLAELKVAPQAEAGVAGPSTAPLAGERRVVSILFCDVKGSTAMAEGLDPEDWAGIIQRAMEYLIEPVNRHGGTVAQVMGDGILALFGAPAAHEDDPQRAVLAGLEIVEGISIFHTQVKHTRGLDFNVRVGVHTGLAVVGDVGAEDQSGYTALGDAVNLAARMEQTAQPGTLQVSAQTYHLVQQQFDCAPLGEIKVKGKQKPLPVYRVTGFKGKPVTTRGLERQGLQSPLVGRDAEFAVLQASIQELLAGHGSIIGIIGEPGIGKSRLLAEIRQHIPQEQLHWLEGNTLSFGQTISYWPFQEILRRFAQISERDGEDTAWQKLASQISVLFPESTAEILPYVASLLALPLRGDYAARMQLLDSEALGAQIFIAAKRFFERLAGDRPVVLVFEDLHWMDESSVSLLENLLPLVRSVPLVIIGLSRADRNTPAALLRYMISKDYADAYTEIQLSALSRAESGQLMQNLLADDLSGILGEAILNKAEGNPFFLEEVLRALIDLGAIQRDAVSRRWRAAVKIDSLAIPDTVQGVILARLDRLEPGVRQTLRVAAVIGRSFLYRVLQRISAGAEKLDERLSELVYLELIQEKQRLPELEYFFKHALAQETVYESILIQQRRDLHKKVGEALETLFADRLEEFYGLLAHHYAQAEAWEKAQAYLIMSADQAGRIAADAEALEHYQQALAVYGRAFGEQWDPLQRAELERKIGEALFRRGEYAQAIDHMRRALGFLGSPLPASRSGLRLAILSELLRHLGYRLKYKISSWRPAQPANKTIEEKGRAYESLNWIAAVNPEDLLLFVTLRLMNFSEKNGFRPGAIIGFSTFALMLDFMALPRLAQAYFHKAVDLAGQSQHPGAVSTAYTFRAIHENMHCHWNAVKDCALHAIDVQRQSGYWNPRTWALSISNLADMHIHLGEFEQAQARGQELVQFGQDSADRLALCWGLSRQGYALNGMGSLEEAARILTTAMQLARSIPDYQTYVDSGGELGKSYLYQGKLEQALEVFEGCRQQSQEHNLSRSPVTTRYINGLAEAYLLAVERGGQADWNALLKEAGHACQEALKQGKAYHPGMPEAMMLRGRYEWFKGDSRAARKWWERSALLAEQTDVHFDLGRTYFEMGQRLGEGLYLEKAAAIFTQVGAQLYLERIKNLA